MTTFSDDFNRPDSPALGNDWIEKSPDAFAIAGGEVISSVTSSNYWDNIVRRPNTEAFLNGMVQAVFEITGDGIPYPHAVTRIQVDTADDAGELDCYLCFMEGGRTTFTLARNNGSSLYSVLATTNVSELALNTPHRYTLLAIGDTTVSLEATLETWNSGAGQWDVVAQLTANDSSGSRHGAGVAGFGKSVDGLQTFDDFLWSDEIEPPPGPAPGDPDLDQWSAALRRVLREQGNATILCVGDSTTAGADAVDDAEMGSNAKSMSYPHQLAAMFRDNGVKASVAGWYGLNGVPDVTDNSEYTDYDARLVVPSSWSRDTSVVSLSQGALYDSAGSDPVAFTPGVEFDRITIWYRRYPGGGTMEVTVDGGSVLATIDCNGVAGILSQIVNVGSLAGDTAVIEVARDTGTPYLQGIHAWRSDEPEVTIINAGWYGAYGGQMDDGAAPWGLPYGIEQIEPDLTVIHLGINDVWNSQSSASLEAALNVLTEAALQSGSVLLMKPFHVNITASEEDQDTYFEGLDALSATREVPLLDLAVRWGTYGAAAGNGFMSDEVHPTGLGYGDIAQAVFGLIDLGSAGGGDNAIGGALVGGPDVGGSDISNPRWWQS